MKSLIFITTLLLAASSFAVTTEGPKIVKSSFTDAFAPGGFDSNDKVQIVAEGVFNNSCYRPSGYDVKVDPSTKTIRVQSKAYKYEGYCLQMLVPYSQTIDVGILGKGKYKVVQASDNKTLTEVNVAKAAKVEADDYDYAPISQAYLERTNSENAVVINGEFISSCMKLEKVKVTVEPKVVVVQPIISVENRSDCELGFYPFEHREVIDQGMNAGKYLLHVRSMNGNAVNSIVNLN